MMQKLFLFIVFVMLNLLNGQAQLVKKIAEEPIQKGEKDAAILLKDYIPARVRVVGLGDVAGFSKEPPKLNTAILAYLIKEKGFGVIAVTQDDWLLRPLNLYLTGKAKPDKNTEDSFTKTIFAHSPYCTAEFADFVTWLKQYNLNHANKAICFSGLGLDFKIPQSYFFSEYIFPADSLGAAVLARKWTTTAYPDSLASDDIKRWYKNASQNSRKASEKNLLIQCNEDMQHNAAMDTIAALGNKNDIQNGYSFIMNAYVAKILAKEKSNKIIFYGLNQAVAKADMIMNEAGLKIASPGELIYNKIKDSYFVCLTDFADTAFTFTVKNPQEKRFTEDTIIGSPAAQLLFKKSDHFFVSKDASIVKGYVPQCVVPNKSSNIQNLISLRTGILPEDAFFIFKNLSPAAYLNQ